MIIVKLSKRELLDLYEAINFATDDYARCAEATRDKADQQLYEAKGQRLTALYYKLQKLETKAAQPAKP